MNREQALTAIVLDKRVPKKDKSFPVKLRITFLRTQKYYIVQRGLSLSEIDFQKIISSRSKGEHKDLQIFFNEYEARANKIIKNIDEFSFETFEHEFFTHKIKKQTVIEYFDAYIEKLTEEEKHSTATGYTYSKKYLTEFSGTVKIKFKQITIDYLLSFEKWLLYKKQSYTTIGMYMRYLRSILNQAIKDDLLNSKDYPFGVGKYQIPQSKNKKKALTIDEIEKIYNYAPEQDSTEHWARDMWLFSYLCNGMNMADIFHLKYENLSNDKIQFYRQKTSGTSKEKKLITVIITEDVSRIISKWGQKPALQKSYVFPQLTDIITVKDALKKINQAIKIINQYMKRIAVNLDIDKPITTYYARHSFATVLKRKGIASEFIKESLGHTSLQTTESYLDSFEDETFIENAKLLTDFKKR